MNESRKQSAVLRRGRESSIVCLVAAAVIIGLQGGLPMFFPASSFAAEQVDRESSEPKGDPVRELPPELTSMAKDREDNLWIGCLYGGLYCYREGEFRRFDAYNCPIPDSGVSAIWVDDNDVKWIGTPRGYVYSFDGKTWKVHAEIKDTIERIRRDGQGRIWLLGDRLKFLADETTATAQVLEVPERNENIAQAHLETMDIDGEGNVWVGTLTGLARYDGKGWSYPDDESRVGGAIRDIWCDRRSGTVYVSALSGYYQYDHGTWTALTVPGPTGGAASGTIHGSEGGLVGVIYHLGRGAAVLQEGKWLSLGDGPPLENDWLTGITTDKAGRFYFIGRRGGLRSFDGENWTSYPVSKNLFCGMSDARLLWRQTYLDELRNKGAIEVDIHEVLQNPRPFFGKQIRFIGRIESSFEYANFLDADGQKLNMWPDYHRELYEFLRDGGREKEFTSAEPKEFSGYLEYGGYFGHMGGYARQFYITEMCTLSSDAPAKSVQKQQLSDYLDRIRRNRWIRPAPTNEATREAKRRLQGVWRLESATLRRRPQTVEDGEGIVFSGDNLVFHEGGHTAINGYEVDPLQEPPAIDQFVAGDDDESAAGRFPGLRRNGQKGIYRIDGDRLTICFGKTDVRPREFVAQEDPGTALLVLRRVERLDARTPKKSKPALTPDEARSAENLKK